MATQWYFIQLVVASGLGWSRYFGSVTVHEAVWSSFCTSFWIFLPLCKKFSASIECDITLGLRGDIPLQWPRIKEMAIQIAITLVSAAAVGRFFCHLEAGHVGKIFLMALPSHWCNTGRLEKETFLQIIFNERLLGHLMNLIYYLFPVYRGALLNIVQSSFARFLTNRCIDICRFPIKLLFYCYPLKIRRHRCSDKSEST